MKRLLCLAAVLALTPAALAQSAPLPPDLAAIPSDALAFGHVKLADLWKSDALKDVRDILQKAGTKTLEAFDQRFSPMPSTVDRVSYFIPAPTSREFEPEPIILLTVRQPIDQPKFLQQIGRLEKQGPQGSEYHVDPDNDLAIRFIGEQTVAVGTVDGIKRLGHGTKASGPGPLSSAIALAATKAPVVVGLNVPALPKEISRAIENEVPRAMRALLKAESVALDLDFEKDGQVRVRIAYGDAGKAEAAEKTLAIATELARGYINETRKELNEMVFGEGKQPKAMELPLAVTATLGLGALQHAEDLLAQKPIRREGNDLVGVVPLPPQFKTLVAPAAVASGASMPALIQVRQAANRMRSSSNLKQIGLAMHNHQDTFGYLPSAAVCDPDGKPLLSWRVTILPFIDQDNLYKQFRLNEPWDSEHNKKLIDKMPRIYALPHKSAKPGETHYRAIVGEAAFVDLTKNSKLSQVTDGLSNTWMVVEAEEGIPWTKPVDFEFDPKNEKLPKFGKFFMAGFHALYGDGSVRLHKKVPEQVKLLMQKNDGEPVQQPKD